MNSENNSDNAACPICACCKKILRPGLLLGNDTNLATCKAALLILRLAVGIIFTYHGLQKGFGCFGGKGFEGAIGAATATGLKPAEFWAFMLVLAELGGGLAITLGVGVRIGAALNAIVMAVAMLTVHRGDPFAATHTQQMLLIACIALAIAGGGMCSLWPAKTVECCSISRQDE